MDFIVCLARFYTGNDAVLTVVNRFLKTAHFTPCRHKITAEETAQLPLRVIVRLHGVPLSIVSDRDPRFTGSMWREMGRLRNIQRRLSSFFHPETDGQSQPNDQTADKCRVASYMAMNTGGRNVCP